MLRSIILWKLAQEEKVLGESMDYLRHIVRVSLRAFIAFTKILSISKYRRTLPLEAASIARIVATRDEDCGTCVQIEINLARKAGISTDMLRAVLERRPGDLPPPLHAVYGFAESVASADYQDASWREKVKAAYGEEGIVELALAIASARFFPVTKRALGYAVSCKTVEIRV